MKAVVGLGNPGRRYEGTRHNLGFMVVEAVARRPGARATGAAREQFESLVMETTLGDERILLVKPQTYMNLAGSAVQPLLAWHKIAPADCLVICDDLNLPVGRLRFRAGGSAGGHHGLEDIEQRLATQEYPRLRIGLGLPAGWVVESFVLGKFSGEELKAIEPAVKAAAEGVELWATKGVNAAANRFNPGPKPPKDPPKQDK
ncbi:MAG: peptidyl-tRNA hydrolase PTH1 [Planctomycetota bacterium]|nr:MAG: peptidyl-tRNA hydrolase PTH1 [Planctomycetota bacterium]